MRLAGACAVALVLHATGCLPAGFRVGRPPIDAGAYAIRNQLTDAVPRAVSDAVQASAPVGGKTVVVGASSTGSTGEHEWSVHVQHTHADGRVEPLPAEQYESVMWAVEAALRPEFDAKGIEVLATTPTRPARERPGAVGFVIRYARLKGAVAGEVVGLIAPSEQYEGRTKVTVVTSEWCTE